MTLIDTALADAQLRRRRPRMPRAPDCRGSRCRGGCRSCVVLEKFGQLKFVHVHKAQIRDAQGRDHDEGKERVLHIGVVERAATGGHGGDHGVGFGGHLAGGAVGHEARNGQFDKGEFRAVFPDGHAAAYVAQTVGGKGHVGAVGADDDHVVAVVCDSRGDGHLPLVAEARDKAVHHFTGGAVTFDQGDLGDAAFPFDDAVDHGQVRLKRLGRGLVFDHADHAGLDTVAAFGGLDLEIGGGKRFAQMHRGAGVVGPVEVRAVHHQFAMLGHGFTARDHLFDGERFQVRGQDHVGAPAGGEGAKLALQTEVGGSVDRGHLKGNQRVAAAVDGVPHHAVHVAVVHQRARMAVVGAEDEIARIEPLFGDRRDLAFHVVPGRTKPHHRAHAVPDPRNRIRLGGAFVIVGRATCHIS